MMNATGTPPPGGPGPRHVKLSDSLGGGAHLQSTLSLASTASEFNALPPQAEEEMVQGVHIPSHIEGRAWQKMLKTSNDEF